MSLKENLIKLKKESIPENVTLVAVSKTRTPEEISEIYNTGHKVFGENRAQEMAGKYSLLPKDIEWHFIGHLQTNKIKFISPFVSLIHSVDSLKLLTEINKEALKNNRIIDCLLEFYIATEQTKYGLSIEETEELLRCSTFKQLKNIRLKGVMGMASFSEDNDLVRNEFKHLKSIFEELKHKYFMNDDAFCEISMGMSGDYKTAIEEGSSIVRIGTAIFG